MSRPLGTIFGATAALLTALVLAAPAQDTASRPLAGIESGRGVVGEWTLVWRYDPYEERRSPFRYVMGHEPEFPHRAAVTGTPEILFFDGDGRVVEKVPLANGERALPAADGQAYLVWSAVPTSRRLLNYRYHRRGQVEPVWEASAVGEPMLFAPDGSLFVIAAADTAHDGFQRALPQQRGNVQVVDAEGGILGELPIRPTHVRLTGDGARIALLHPEELVVLRADGRLDWNVNLPVDALLEREGHSQLEAAGGLIIVTGTGETDDSTALRPRRRGTIHAFSDSGRSLWTVTQSDRDPLWFQVSCALSPDGGTLATFHSETRDIVVQLWEARTGELLWRYELARAMGARCLTVAPNGELVVLTSGDLRTSVVAWDREGSVVWEGTVPFPPEAPHIEADGLLVSSRWVARLTPEWEP